jgi:purine-binding chemotaxis protein CheW
MDILAARKKAAEKSKARLEPEPEAASPAEPRPAADDDAGRVPEAPVAAPVSLPPEPGSETAAPAAAAPDLSPGDGNEKELSTELELLAFRMGGEEYAVMVNDVREVLKLRDLTAVPNTPEYILGVMSLRGTMLTVIDLGRRLGLAPGVRDDRARIVVVGTDEEDVGLMVDRVTGVLKIMPEGIKPPPENVEQGAEYLRGIVRKDDRLVILLDLAKAVGV